MDYAVRFTDVRKEYPFYQHITAGVKSFLFNLPRSISAFRRTRFEALKGVSFAVHKGETFGIIGRNGSGKSTILSLIANVIRQDSGSIEINGKISSLLELGAGFHPDLSGIENIIMNGILMGNRREEILKKADEIIAFSELGEFIFQPLRTYSSGMQMRLGFSVAIHIEPEILLIDEALAVGDISFQEKCLSKMEEFKKLGTTIIIVSHDMTAIAKLCDKVAFIDNGTIMEIGGPITVIKAYLGHIGHPIHIEIEEEQTSSEKDIRGEVAEDGILNNANLVSETVAEADISVDTGEIPPALVPPPSWWDSPVIMRQCEAIITGNPEINLYEFLKKEYSIEHLQRGLSICHKLKGIQNNFVQYDTCRFFDVISDSDEIARMCEGESGFQKTYYDLFLCIDLLNHVKNLAVFLANVDVALKSNGIILALEYIGPANFRWTEKQITIANMIYGALDNHSDLSTPSAQYSLSRVHYEYDKDAAAAVSSENVIVLLQKQFDITAVRYFGGPFYDLVLNKILNELNFENEKDLILVKTIIQCEQILIRNGVIDNTYALIIAKKRSS